MTHENGHNSGTEGAESRANCGVQRRALARQATAQVGAIAPRLLDLSNAARYLGISEWTLRDMEHARLLPRVRLPMPADVQKRPRSGRSAGSGELRKLLFDREDLDKLIESWKEREA